MLQKILLPIVVFIVVMIGLAVGEDALSALGRWIYDLTGIVIYNFQDLYQLVAEYIAARPMKIFLALILTAIICFWIYRNKETELAKPANQRKITVFLAIFLGWLGIHRFYLNQIGRGLLFLFLSFIWLPLAVFIGFIDAIRYLSMTDEDFEIKFKP